MSYVDNLINSDDIIEKSYLFNHEIEEIYLNDNGKVFINLARLSVEKGHDQLIHAFYEIVKNDKNTRLLILGDGPLRYELSSLIEKLGLEKNVFLLGRIDNPFPYLKKADCFVLSSKYEGQGLVLLEAMVLGKPVICTDFPCAHDVLEQGRLGLIVENSAKGLTHGMQDFLEGKLHFDVFDAEKYQTNALKMFYKKVCGESTTHLLTNDSTLH